MSYGFFINPPHQFHVYGRRHQSSALDPASAVVSSVNGALHTVITIHYTLLLAGPFRNGRDEEKGSFPMMRSESGAGGMEAGCGMAEESLSELTPPIQF